MTQRDAEPRQREKDCIEEAKKWKRSKPMGYFLMRKIARALNNTALGFVSRFIWIRQSMACDYCGKLVGFDSTVSKYGFTCEACLKELENENSLNPAWPRK